MRFNVDDRVAIEKKRLCIISLLPRSETIAQLLTTTGGHKTGILGKMEVAVGVYVGESLTAVDEGKCIVSVVNANGCEVTIEMAPVELELVEDEAIDVELIDEVGIVSTEGRIREMRKQFRLGHLAAREQRENLKISEVYNDVLCLPGDKLSSTHWVVHAVPTEGTDPGTGIASRS